jgi:hypothetical protein
MTLTKTEVWTAYRILLSGRSSESDEDGATKHYRGRNIKRMAIAELRAALAQLKLSTKVGTIPGTCVYYFIIFSRVQQGQSVFG